MPPQHHPPPLRPPPSPTPPTFANYPSTHLIQGSGVAIFHVASGRVVVCRAVDRRLGVYYFLPKGRRDVGEDGGTAGVREGWEESGYPNRLLPLATPHNQPTAPGHAAPRYTTEPVYMQLLPLGRRGIQYLLSWYIAETLPPSLYPDATSAKGVVGASGTASIAAPTLTHTPPPPYPPTQTLRQRIALEPEGWEPIKHEGTGVDDEERAYESFLVGWEEGIRLVGGGVMGEVIRIGWEGVVGRMSDEAEGTGS